MCILYSIKRRVTILYLLGLFIFLPFLNVLAAESSSNPSDSSLHSTQDEIVVFLHGALKSPYSMKRLENAFRNEGYNTLNFNWEGRTHSVQWNAAKLDSILAESGAYEGKVHFVTHSMGTLVVRYFLDEYHVPSLGRFVMIAPPNQGSDLATELQDFPPFLWIYKETVDYLTTGQNGFAANIGIPDCEFGIIAGGTGGEHGLTWYLPGDDDSVLSVDNTKLAGAKDFMLIDASHSMILIQNETLRNALHFIKYGNFIHSNAEEGSLTSNR